MSFNTPFIPRKLLKKSHFPSNAPPLSSSSSQHVVAPPTLTEPTSSNISDEDIASWIYLSVADHALFLDTDIRNVLLSDPEGEEKDSYIPLGYLLRHSPVLSNLEEFAHLPESRIIKALRSFLPNHFDVRVLISEPPKAAWFAGHPAMKGKEKERDELGGYEIRWKGGRELKDLTGDEWNRRTVYMERIPIHHRTIPSILRFVLSLSSTDENPVTRIQAVTLPPHHADDPSTRPTRCKGFAFVTFSSKDDADSFVERWPWEREHSSDSFSSLDTPVAKEAERFGFRTIPLTRWVELKEEYLSYRARLLDQMNPPTPVPQPSLPPRSSEAPTTSLSSLPPPSAHPQPLVSAITLSDPYPPNCLVFVRNIHPETNKTTLRSLFSAALKTGREDGIDYVDFNKGMDSCYLRLSSPEYTALLTQHFDAQAIVQTTGLDGSGSSAVLGSTRNDKAIRVEVVEGKREALYWEKVPEKVRRSAVSRVVQLMVDGGSDGQSESLAGERKRRRRD